MAVGTLTLANDLNGNLNKQTGTTTGAVTNYVYDIENRLVSASGGVSGTLRYDPLGRLYEVSGSGGTTRFLYDGDELVAEYDGAGALLRRYVHASGVSSRRRRRFLPRRVRISTRAIRTCVADQSTDDE